LHRAKLWTMRMFAGFGTAEETNGRFKYLLDQGQTGLSIAFDLATLMGYDTDRPEALGEFGKCGVAISSLKDMEILLDGIPLDKVSTSMTINSPASVIWAMYIAAAEKQGVRSDQLRGTIQNDILKEYIAQKEFIFPPEPSMRLVVDTMEFGTQEMPLWNTISISGYHIREAGSTAAQELAFTLADGMEYVRWGVKRGMDIDDFAPRLSFFWGIGMNHFLEIAKMRAARLLWANLVKPFQPKSAKSLALRTHCQTSGWSLTEQDPFNNVARTTIEALAAVFGGTQSLHTNSFDEAIALPTDFSAKIARDTQLFIQKESEVCRAIDPWAGSYYVERLTAEVAQKAWALIEEIESKGGMAKAIEEGLPKLRIEEAAARKQARIDAGEDGIIGVNMLRANEESPFEILEVDNSAVRAGQIRRIAAVKASRDDQEVERALEELQRIAETGDGNLLESAVKAARARATLGEISAAMERVFGRYSAAPRAVSGVFMKEMSSNADFEKARAMTNAFAAAEGRRPRIMIAKLGQDGHDRGAKVIATAFADIGFDVDIGPLFQTPEEAARQAVENDVHILGISSLAAGHKTLAPQTIAALRQMGREDILVVVGGVIPKQDYDFLKEAGVAAVFGPGTVVAKAAMELLEVLQTE